MVAARCGVEAKLCIRRVWKCLQLRAREPWSQGDSFVIEAPTAQSTSPGNRTAQISTRRVVVGRRGSNAYAGLCGTPGSKAGYSGFKLAYQPQDIGLACATERASPAYFGFIMQGNNTHKLQMASRVYTHCCEVYYRPESVSCILFAYSITMRHKHAKLRCRYSTYVLLFEEFFSGGSDVWQRRKANEEQLVLNAKEAREHKPQDSVILSLIDDLIIVNLTVSPKRSNPFTPNAL